ncbi:hypothetical protein ACVWWI_006262 [Bradyrhizobium sp. USDA 3686]|nr:hypothetical protein [Bradyrhizobium canariense]
MRTDEVLCERWVENSYYQYFCGEELFQHRLVFDRSSLTRWRNRMAEERLAPLIQESLSVATRTKAIKPSDLSRVTVTRWPTVIPDMEALVGNTIARILAGKGIPRPQCAALSQVQASGQKRGVTPKIKRELRRRAAVEPVIGHLKAEHRMGRNYLWRRQGDAANAVLAAAGYNFRRLIRWLSLLLRQILTALTAALQTAPA